MSVHHKSRWFALCGVVFVASLTWFTFGRSSVHAAPSDNHKPAPILLELFTSQGCSSCPPADRLLSEFGKRKKTLGVLPLSFHVDYWNYIGWRDVFSDSDWSDRQKRYGRSFQARNIYTPQLVVQGKTDCVGSKRRCIEAAVRDARARTPRAGVAIEEVDLDKDARTLSLRISARLLEPSRPAQLMVAVYENGLVTQVARGGNARRTLRNDHVVRRLETLASFLKPVPNGQRVNATIPIDKRWNMDQVGAAIFLQATDTQEILAAADVPPR